MKALEKNKTWSVMKLPDGKRTVGCKWVFTVKYNSVGQLKGTRLAWWLRDLRKPMV